MDATPHKDVVARRLGDRTVVVNLRTNRIYELNPTAARLWELLEAGCERGRIEQTLLEEYDADHAKVRREVDVTLATLSKEGLINEDDD
jgi:Coenzyme PQQ synthesis protein D (PqqD)